MLGGIVGDVLGSIYELNPIKFKNFELFNPIVLKRITPEILEIFYQLEVRTKIVLN